MTGSNHNRPDFLGTYFDRDEVLKASRLAGILAWLALGVHGLAALVSFLQFLFQYAAGMFFQKGITALDQIAFFTPYLLQVIPGLVYFGLLKFVQHGLLILMDVEENTRRASASK
jgi:hypothetical protein